jgi:hypothetical protein
MALSPDAERPRERINRERAGWLHDAYPFGF